MSPETISLSYSPTEEEAKTTKRKHIQTRKVSEFHTSDLLFAVVICCSVYLQSKVIGDLERE